MLAIRMTRHGAKKRPFFHIVVADSRSPRDGRFLERLGSYDPILKAEDGKRVVLKEERIRYWLGHGAQVSDRVHRFLHRAGIKDGTAAGDPRLHGTGKKAEELAKKRAEAEAKAA